MNQPDAQNLAQQLLFQESCTSNSRAKPILIPQSSITIIIRKANQEPRAAKELTL
jgi:hypothetical protein